MKSLFNIYEGILSDIEQNISKSDIAIDKMYRLGNGITLKTVIGCNEANAKMFNASTLKRLTKNLDYTDDNIKNGIFDKRNKFKMFINWITNLTIEEIGFPIEIDSENFRTKLSKRLQTLCDNEGVFNNPYYTQIFVPSIRATAKDRFEIMIHRLDNYAPGMKFKFELK
jgi:hypothetical protein